MAKKNIPASQHFLFFFSLLRKIYFFVFKMKDWISKFAYKKKNTFSEAIRTLQKGTTGSLN